MFLSFCLAPFARGTNGFFVVCFYCLRFLCFLSFRRSVLGFGGVFLCFSALCGFRADLQTNMQTPFFSLSEHSEPPPPRTPGENLSHTRTVKTHYYQPQRYGKFCQKTNLSQQKLNEIAKIYHKEYEILPIMCFKGLHISRLQRGKRFGEHFLM